MAGKILNVERFRRGFLSLVLISVLAFADGFAYSQKDQVLFIDSLHLKLSQSKGQQKAEILIKLSGIYMTDEPAKALGFASEAVKLARKTGNKHLLSDAFKLQADSYYYLDSLPASLQAYLQSAENDNTSLRPRKDSILRRLGDAGHVYYQLGLFENAIEYHSRALQMSKALKDSAEIATNIYNLGVSFKMLGDYAKAIDYFLQTLDLDQLMGNKSDLSSSYNSSGMVYFAWGNLDKALEFLEMALEHDFNNGMESRMSVRLSNISKVYLAMKRYDDAIDHLKRALAIDRRHNNVSREAIRLQGLGLAYGFLGRNGDALVYFNEALGIYVKLQLDYKIAGLLIQMGEIYLNDGQEAEAVKSYEEGLKLAQQLRLRPEEMDAVNRLYDYYKARGRFAEALYFLENFKSLQDSMFSEKSAQLIHDFEVKYETEKERKENQLLLKENEIRKRTHRFSMAAISFLVILSVISFWAFALKRKSLAQSKELFASEKELSRLKIESVENQNTHLREMLFAEEEIKKLQIRSLEQQKQELTTATMLIANKNEVFEKLKKLAEQIKTNGDNSNQDQAREIISEIDRQTDLSDQWEQFKIHFESIHRSFFENLRNVNGCLTQNDLQLCAYIKLNLSTKEISRLMNITPESVNTHRYRLRKKLQLPAEQTLDELVHGL
jgi:tetratricopeptide (TPR) repeat protein